MKIKSSAKYQLIDMIKPFVIFYFVMFCLLVLGFAAFKMNNVNVGSSVVISSPSISGTGFSGMEAASAIFLFVYGLNSFKEFFRMLTQNGMSRKTIFIGRIITFLTVCAGMAVIDRIILVIGKLIVSYFPAAHFTGLFEMIYAGRETKVSGLAMHIDGMLFNFCLYLAFIAIGYFITIGFYRMNKIGKISVAIGVPMILFNAVPFLDAALLHGAIGNSLMNTLSFAYGFKNGANPYFGMVSSLLIFGIFAGLSWLAMRKAVVKD